jgi:uncharacterized DUF497 family protein
MALEFDPAKDAANIAKHGVSLSRTTDFVMLAVVRDERFEEPRWRAYGTVDDEAYCLAFTTRGNNLRAISLRRAHAKEIGRYVQKA